MINIHLNTKPLCSGIIRVINKVIQRYLLNYWLFTIFENTFKMKLDGFFGIGNVCFRVSPYKKQPGKTDTVTP
ncbi:hypothetical protein BHC45_09235 [Snodgrassella alvi]|nr:hypothetical protein BHC45_09235 [Snodgrassella alvi]PIT67571.1 hypothetical protein BHC52_03975 [Snodgrassella alvi]